MGKKRKRKTRKRKSDIDADLERLVCEIYDYSDEYNVNVKPTYQKPYNQYKNERY